MNNKEEITELCITFCNTNYFSSSVKDDGIYVIGKLPFSEMRKLIANKFFEIERVLNENGYKIVKE